MAAKPTLAQAWIGLTPTLDGAQRQIEKDLEKVDTDKPGKKVGAGFGKALAAGAAIAGALIVKGISSSIDAASDLSESLNAVNVTYGEQAGAVKKLGEQAANSLGLSNAEFNGLAVQFSSFAKGIAGEGGDVVGTLDDITTRASDFASVMNLEVADAAAIFQSGLAGETEPLKKYGIDLSAAAVEAYALSEGIWDGTGTMSEAMKVQARYGSLMEQTSKTQGDFSNTSGEFANQQRILKANTANLQAELGTKLLPVMSQLTAIGLKVVDWISQNVEWLGPLAAGIGAAVAVTWLFNAALAANPIGLIVAAIAALVTGLVLFFTKTELGQKIWQGFTDFLVKAWDWIKKAAKSVWDFLVKVWSWSPLGIIVSNWDKITAAFSTVVGKVKGFFQDAWDFIKKAWSYSPLGLIITNWDKIMKFFGDLPGKVRAVFDRVGDAIKGVFKNAFNAVARLWNNSLGKLSIDIPDIPGLPGRGQTFSFPKLPYLADGGTAMRAGWSVVGEQGPELRYMPRGASVVPLDHPASTMAGVGDGGGVVRLHPDDIAAVVRGMLSGARLSAQGVTRSALFGDLFLNDSYQAHGGVVAH